MRSCSTSPPRSCSFLSFSGSYHGYHPFDLVQTTELCFMLLFPVSCVVRAETQEEGLQAVWPLRWLLNAGLLYMHWCTPGLSNPSHCLDKYGMHVFSWKVLTCLSFPSLPHSENEDKDPQFPPERTVKGVYLCVSSTGKHRMGNVYFNVALEEGSKLEVVTRGKSGWWMTKSRSLSVTAAPWQVLVLFYFMFQ